MMYQVAFGYDAEVMEWVATRIPGMADHPFRPPFHALGVVLDGIIKAGVVYHDFLPSSCMMSVAADCVSWPRHDVLAHLFALPFGQWNFRSVGATCAKKNKRARRFVEHLGFQYEGNRRDALPDDDVILYGMRRSECRWIGAQDGQGKRQRAIAA